MKSTHIYCFVTNVSYDLCTTCRYFESGVCSVYLWDLDHGFAGVVLIKKAGDTERTKGCWDSIHVVEVQVSLYSHHYCGIFRCLPQFQSQDIVCS